MCQGWDERTPGAPRPGEARLRRTGLPSGQWEPGKGKEGHLLSEMSWRRRSVEVESERAGRQAIKSRGVGALRRVWALWPREHGCCGMLSPRPRPCTLTWEQLLAQGSTALPVTGSQLCGRVQLLQGQTLTQDVGLRIRACVQLGSKQREGALAAGCLSTAPLALGAGRRPRASPFSSLHLSFLIWDTR